MPESVISQWPHGDRKRAESFGEAAGSYDRLRPPYPATLFDDLAGLFGDPNAPLGDQVSPLGDVAALPLGHALDIGCGTGKVASALAERGVSVLGIEPDERMADLARARGIPVEVATFERWEDEGRKFDLIACGNSWHWVDPVAGCAKVARVLRHGGAFAMFWVVDVLEEAVLEALQPVYREHAPDTRIYGTLPPPQAAENPLVGFDALGAVEGRVYPAERVLTAAQWAELLTTVSDHRRLDAASLASMVQAVEAAIESLGGTVRSTCETRLWLVRRS